MHKPLAGLLCCGLSVLSLSACASRVGVFERSDASFDAQPDSSSDSSPSDAMTADAAPADGPTMGGDAATVGPDGRCIVPAAPTPTFGSYATFRLARVTRTGARIEGDLLTRADLREPRITAVRQAGGGPATGYVAATIDSDAALAVYAVDNALDVRAANGERYFLAGSPMRVEALDAFGTQFSSLVGLARTEPNIEIYTTGLRRFVDMYPGAAGISMPRSDSVLIEPDATPHGIASLVGPSTALRTEAFAVVGERSERGYRYLLPTGIVAFPPAYPTGSAMRSGAFTAASMEVRDPVVVASDDRALYARVEDWDFPDAVVYEGVDRSTLAQTNADTGTYSIGGGSGCASTPTRFHMAVAGQRVGYVLDCADDRSIFTLAEASSGRFSVVYRTMWSNRRAYVASRVTWNGRHFAVAWQERDQATPTISLFDPAPADTNPTNGGFLFSVRAPAAEVITPNIAVGVDITADPVTGDFALAWITNDTTAQASSRDFYLTRFPPCLRGRL